MYYPLVFELAVSLSFFTGELTLTYHIGENGTGFGMLSGNRMA